MRIESGALSGGVLVWIASIACAQQHPFVECAQQVFPGGVPVYEQFDRIPSGGLLGGGSVADFDGNGQIDQADVDAFDEAFQACSP